MPSMTEAMRAQWQAMLDEFNEMIWRRSMGQVPKTHGVRYTLCDGCPHLGLDGGPSPVMVCQRSNTGYIVSWRGPEPQQRTSDQCPLPAGQRPTVALIEVVQPIEWIETEDAHGQNQSAGQGEKDADGGPARRA